MYIAKTLRGDVKIDFDELEKIKHFDGKGLLFLRNGAINVSHITSIVLDENAIDEVVKSPGETDEDVKRKLLAYKSEDIFASIRGPALLGGNKFKELQ